MFSKTVKKSVLRIDASQPLHAPAGLLLGKMYYGSFLQNSLKEDEYSGYPNNGPEHTLRLHLTLGDLKSFLDLVIETFKSPAAEEFVQSVMRSMALNPFDVASMQNIVLKGK